MLVQFHFNLSCLKRLYHPCGLHDTANSNQFLDDVFTHRNQPCIRSRVNVFFAPLCFSWSCYWNTKFCVRTCYVWPFHGIYIYIVWTGYPSPMAHGPVSAKTPWFLQSAEHMCAPEALVGSPVANTSQSDSTISILHVRCIFTFHKDMHGCIFTVLAVETAMIEPSDSHVTYCIILLCDPWPQHFPSLHADLFWSNSPGSHQRPVLGNVRAMIAFIILALGWP